MPFSIKVNSFQRIPDLENLTFAFLLVMERAVSKKVSKTRATRKRSSQTFSNQLANCHRTWRLTNHELAVLGDNGSREQLQVHGHEPVFAGQLHGASGRMVFTRPTKPDSSLTLMPWG